MHVHESIPIAILGMQTAPSFTYDHSAEGKFEGPAQKAMKEQEAAKAMEEEDRKQVRQAGMSLFQLPAAHKNHACACMRICMHGLYTNGVCTSGFLVMHGGSRVFEGVY